VVQTSGKQYLVKPKDVLQVDRMKVEVGQTVEIRPVLAVSDGKALRLGRPDVADSKVVITVLKHIRGKKVISFRKKRRKGYHKKHGHRQDLTVLRVESIAQA
jgi:large subunit ribosomal protein L21